MKTTKALRVLMAGGDARQVYAAHCLSGFSDLSVQTIGLPDAVSKTPSFQTAETLAQIQPFDVLILPVPASTDGKTVCRVSEEETEPILLEDLAKYGKPDGLVLAGQCDDAVRTCFLSAGFEVIDYFQREALALANAIPTAEGAIQIAMEKMPITLHGANVFVLGYGRIGMALLPRLQGLNANVMVGARRLETRTLAEMQGADTTALDSAALKQILPNADLIINTIPAKILTADILAYTSPEVWIIDLASRPGGTDFAAAERLGRNTVWALALPGKVAPKTAGKIIADTVRQILEERRMCGVRSDK